MNESIANPTTRLPGGGAPAEPRETAPAAPGATPIFLADSSDGADLLGAGEVLGPLAELCLSPAAQTPFLAGLVGPAGAGKSFALNRLAAAVERLAGRPPALARVVVARLDASAGGDPVVGLAAAVYAALDAGPAGVDYSAILDEATHAGGDPLRAARAAADRHDDILRRLDSERAARDEVEGRRARLADALLYETPGSRVDAYARANRAAIEGRLRRFELAGADASQGYRDLVRDAASVGAASRVGVALRSVWTYRSQWRLLSLAIVAFALAIGLALLRGDAALATIRGFGAAFEPAAAWVRDHDGWFAGVERILALLGALLLALNLSRALAFTSSLARGVRLLGMDLRERQRDLEASSARLAQRVAALTAEADAAAKRAETAARRAGGKAATRAPGPAFLAAAEAPAAAARGFLAELGRRVGVSGGAGNAPDRLVFVLDAIDGLAPENAVRWIEATHAALGPGCVGLLAVDPARLIEACGGEVATRRRFEKWLQIVVALPRAADADGGRLLARLLSGAAPERAPAAGETRAVGEPLSGAETALLTALAPMAVRSPRGAKRFLNAYRLARSAKASRPAVALMLAVALSGDDAARAEIEERLAANAGELAPDESGGPLAQAIKAACGANGGPIGLEEARRAHEVAGRYVLSF